MLFKSAVCVAVSRSEAEHVLNCLQECGIKNSQLFIMFTGGEHESKDGSDGSNGGNSDGSGDNWDPFWTKITGLGEPRHIPGVRRGVMAVGKICVVLPKGFQVETLGGIAGLLQDIGVSEMDALAFEEDLGNQILIVVRATSEHEDAAVSKVLEKAFHKKELSRVGYFHHA